MKTINEVVNNLNIQDNHCTELPLFAVERKVLHYGIDYDFDTDGYHWIDVDEGEIETDEERAKELDEHYLTNREDDLWLEVEDDDGGMYEKQYRKVWYRVTWEFVTCCLTQKGCEGYINVNGHNHGGPENLRIFVHSGYRNFEMETIINFLKSYGV